MKNNGKKNVGSMKTYTDDVIENKQNGPNVAAHKMNLPERATKGFNQGKLQIN
jgi:hypothetical protein